MRGVGNKRPTRQIFGGLGSRPRAASQMRPLATTLDKGGARSRCLELTFNSQETIQMPSGPTLPSEFVSAAREGRLVLFLGAGASQGATNGLREIPDGTELAQLIVNRFLLPSHEGLNLKEAYDLACSRRSVRELQRFLHDTLIDYQPTAAHLLIPHIPWAGIATTNYDLIVERAYDAAGRGPDLVVSARDGARPLDAVPREKTIYLKLHGCVTEYENVDTPLITSTEQIIDHKNGRSNLFKTFLEWGQNHPMAIVGYGMNDEKS